MGEIWIQSLKPCYTYVCVYVKLQEWVLSKQVIAFTPKVCIFKNGIAKVKEKRKRHVLMDFK